MSEPKTTVRHRYCGLRDVYVAKVTQNDTEGYTAGTPVKMARAIKAKISDKFTSEKLYSDDGVEGMLQAYEGTDVELEVNTLAAADRAAFFGQAYLNGFLLKSAEDEAPEVALGYRVRRLNGKFDFVWMYCGRFAQGNEENYETEAASKTAQTNTVKGEFYQREKTDKVDGKDVHLYEVRVDESNLATEDTGAAAAIKAWFGKVQEYAATVGG
jgi:phi13 family phage major tail protein|nr:MAG TPA: major tail protein [Caudoviricetes sp.]